MTADIAKVDAIRKCFAPLIAARIDRYRTAELLHDDGTWESWPDLPIRIYTDSHLPVSVAWSKFDDLWLANDNSLPFDVDDARTRWIENKIVAINGCLGRTIRGVMLGRGEMSIEDREIEIWTRLVIDLEYRWLEIFNALDENGYELHSSKPTGEFVNCL
jgi:hypothetical protein